MKHYLYSVLGLFALGLSAHANAQNDVTAILGNLGPSANTLTAGLGDTLVNTGPVLTGGAQPFGSLEPGLALAMDNQLPAILDNFVDLSGIEATLMSFDPTNPDHLVGLPFALPQLLSHAIGPTVQPLFGLHDQLQQEVIQPLVGDRLCLLPTSCGFLDPDYEPPPPGALEPLIDPLIESVNNL